MILNYECTILNLLLVSNGSIIWPQYNNNGKQYHFDFNSPLYKFLDIAQNTVDEYKRLYSLKRKFFGTQLILRGINSNPRLFLHDIRYWHKERTITCSFIDDKTYVECYKNTAGWHNYQYVMQFGTVGHKFISVDSFNEIKPIAKKYKMRVRKYKLGDIVDFRLCSSNITAVNSFISDLHDAGRMMDVLVKEC